MPNGLFGTIADNNLVWAVPQFVFTMQLVADGLRAAVPVFGV